MQEDLNDESCLGNEKSFDDLDFKTWSEIHPDSSTRDDSIQDQIHLRRLSETKINVTERSDDDDDVSTGRKILGHMDAVIDEESNDDSSESNCSMKVTISDPEPASSLAVLQSVQKLKEKENSDRVQRAAVSTPLNCGEFSNTDVNLNDEGGDPLQDNDQCRDNYVRSVTRFRSLLDDAFRRTGQRCNSAGTDVGDTDELSDGIRRDKPKKRKARYSEPIDDPIRRNRLDLMFREDPDTQVHNNPLKSPAASATATLLKSKVSEILLLRNSLKESQEHANALSFANATLREASITTAARMERTTEALRIAGINAANARADADAALAKAATLATQVSSMKSALAETKRTCDTIRDEHEAISKASKQLEIRYLQLEAELSKVDQEKERLLQERADLSDKFDKLYDSKRMSDQIIDEKSDEVKRLKKMLVERDDVEQVRVDRVHRIETELREARALLAEATFVAAESESMTALLNETIKELRNENKSLHDQISVILDNASKDRNRVQEELTQSEREAQKLRLKVTTHVEDIDRMTLDKADSDKEIASLKRQLMELEKRLAASTSVSNNDDKVSAPSYRDESDGKTPSTSRLSTIPPIRSIATKNICTDSEKENKSESDTLSGKRLSLASKSSICSICHKASFGMMKSCQCGRPNCDKRAHAMCLVSTNPLPSVSHPGTPAPSLPVILCRGAN